MSAHDMRSWKDAEATIEDDVIVIRLTVRHILSAMAQHPDDMFRGVTVSDVRGFAKDVVRAINEEDERGTSMLHHMFDDAIDAAIEDGSMHVEIDEAAQDGAYVERSPVTPEKSKT